MRCIIGLSFFLLFSTLTVSNSKVIDVGRLLGYERVPEDQIRDTSEFVFSVLLDAGSSSTKLHIYTWKPINYSIQVPDLYEAPIGEIAWGKKTDKGIASLASDPSGVGLYLAPLIKYVQSKIPNDMWNITPIYLMATAGMRALPQYQQDAILNSTRSFLGNLPFRFESSWALVIDGSQEGIYAWITVNFLLGNFRTGQSGTVGTIEMGGASTQITFIPNEVPLSDLFPLQLSETLKYVGYTYSFMGYGNDMARNSIQDQIVNDSISRNPSQTMIPHPCLPIGYETPYANTTYIIYGTSNYTECQEAIVQFIDINATCSIMNCSFDGVYQPELPQITFYAFSGFNFVYNFFNLTPNAPLFVLEETLVDFCAQNFTELLKYKTNIKLTLNYCFMGSYMIGLLHDGFGFAMDYDTLFVEANLNGVDLGWAFGAALNQIVLDSQSMEHSDEYDVIKEIPKVPNFLVKID